jgi:hydroxypyruvate isomerase
MILNGDLINLPKYIFNYLCDSIKEQKTVILYGRLLSNIFYQRQIIELLENLQAIDNPGIIFGKAFDAQTLVQMKLIKTAEASNMPLCIRRTYHIFIVGVPIISMRKS